MQEAFHVIDQVIERLPINITKEEVENYKNLANKGLYRCPYCAAQLRVKYGEKRVVHFSHKHSESCEESKIVEKAEKKYKKQTERETAKHRALVEIFIDELKITAKINPKVSVDFGYRAKKELNQFPDIWLKINQSEIAISIVTNVNPFYDHSLSKEIKKRHTYFLQNRMYPIWFIENKELAVEQEKNAIVLWEAEEAIALKTKEDKLWEIELKSIANDLSFFQLYNYLPTMKELNIDVRSLYYVQSKEDRMIVSIHRFIKDRDTKPFRAFLLANYEIPFSKALVVNEGRMLLSDHAIDEKLRKQFVERYDALVKQKEEEERLKEQQRKEQEGQKELQRLQMIEKRQHEEKMVKQYMSYNDLKTLLKGKINLSHQEQMELWHKYMLPKIGAKNSQKVWDLVLENDVSSFDELREVLEAI